jgi:hypothetical protein
VDVKNRSKHFKDGFLSSDDEDNTVDKFDNFGHNSLVDIPFIEVIRRERGQRININMVDPQNQNNHKLFKMYIANEDFQRMSELVQSHRDIIMMIDGASSNNPGQSGAGIAFFGRKVANSNSKTVNNESIIDISGSEPSSSIFDILVAEK